MAEHSRQVGYSRGVDKQRALAKSNNRTNLERQFDVSFRTSMDPSQTSFFQLLIIGTKRVGPGAAEIVLDLATVALVDGALIFMFSAMFQEVGTFHLAFDTNAFTLGSNSDVVLVSPAFFNVVAPDRGPLDS